MKSGNVRISVFWFNSVSRSYCGGSSRYCPSHYGRRRGLAFFIERREKHYRRLNEEIFRPLLEMGLDQPPKNVPTVSIVGLHDYNFGDLMHSLYIPRDKYSWSNATFHVQKDKPKLLESIDSLESEISKHNGDVSRFESDTRKLIDDKFEEVGIKKAEYPQEGYYYNTILGFLRGAWGIVARNPLKDRESLASGYEKTFRPEVEDGFQKIFSTPIGRGSEEKRAEMLKIIGALMRVKEIPETINAFQNRTSHFNQKIGEINMMASEFVLPIESESYITKCKCCPTIWRLTKDYLF